MFASKRNIKPHFYILTGLRNARIEPYGVILQRRRYFQCRKVCFSDVLHPYAFINTRRLNIPTAETFLFPALFTAYLYRQVFILAAHGKNISGLGKILRNVKGKTGVRSAMFSDQASVDIYLCIVIRSFKIKYCSLVPFSLYPPGIPNDGMRLMFAYSACLTFVGKRDEYFPRKIAGQRRFHIRLFAKPEFPFAV